MMGLPDSAAHDQFVRDRFDTLAGRFKASAEPGDARMAAVREHLGLGTRPARILDLGCGKGRFAVPLAREGHAVVGIDPSAGMLAGCPGEVARVCGTATRLPFEAGAFDHAFAIEVFEHLYPSAWTAALAELRRVIRPGGRLAIVDKNAASVDPARPWLPGLLVKKIDERRGLWMYPSGAPARERWFWPGQMARLLRSAGFVSVRAGAVRFGEQGRLPALLERFQVWSAAVPARGGGA